jgi:hypothetical protein
VRMHSMARSRLGLSIILSLAVALSVSATFAWDNLQGHIDQTETSIAIARRDGGSTSSSHSSSRLTKRSTSMRRSLRERGSRTTSASPRMIQRNASA